MKKKITQQNIKLLHPSRKTFEVFDTELRGFVLRVYPSGVISYYFTYRNVSGRKARIFLGKHGTISPAQARAAAERYAGSVALGGDPATAKKQERAEAKRRSAEKALQRSFRQFVESDYRAWCFAHKKRASESVERLLVKFRAFHDVALEDFTLLEVERWRVGRLKDGIAPATVNRDLAELKAMFTRAVEWGYLKVHPLRHLKMMKADNARIRHLSDDEEERLRRALLARDERIKQGRVRANEWRSQRGYQALLDLSNSGFADHMTPMVLLSLNTGLRKGEIFTLRWSDVNISASTLTVRADKSKSGKRRHVPLNREAVSVLEAWRAQNPSDELVFPSPVTGEVLNNVQKAWSAVLSDAEVEDFHWHDLRHTFASKLAMRGVDLNTIRDLLGHADIKMTLRYAHLAPEHAQTAVELLVC